MSSQSPIFATNTTDRKQTQTSNMTGTCPHRHVQGSSYDVMSFQIAMAPSGHRRRCFTTHDIFWPVNGREPKMPALTLPAS